MLHLSLGNSIDFWIPLYKGVMNFHWQPLSKKTRRDHKFNDVDDMYLGLKTVSDLIISKDELGIYEFSITTNFCFLN